MDILGKENRTELLYASYPAHICYQPRRKKNVSCYMKIKISHYEKQIESSFDY